MARVSLTPINLQGTSLNNAVLPAAGATSLVGFTGVQFINNGSMFLYITIGVGGGGTVTMNLGRTTEGQLPVPFTVTTAASTNYLLGPWSPSDFTSHDGTGQTYFDFSSVVLTAASLYQLIPLT